MRIDSLTNLKKKSLTNSHPFFFLPSTARSLTGMPCRYDMYPKAEKMTNPARMLVMELIMDMLSVSLWGDKTSFKSLTRNHSYFQELAVKHLLQNVVVEVIVAGHCHERAKTNPNGVKDLSRSIHPHLKHRPLLISTNTDYQ